MGGPARGHGSAHAGVAPVRLSFTSRGDSSDVICSGAEPRKGPSRTDLPVHFERKT